MSSSGSHSWRCSTDGRSSSRSDPRTVMEVTTTAGQDHGPKRQTTMTPRPDRVEPAANAALDAPGTRIAGVVLLFLTAHLAGGGCGEQRGPEPASGGAEPIQSVAVPGTPSIATPDTPP